MTDDMMTLRSLLEKSSDADLLREMIGFSAQRLMDLEVQGLTGAEHGKRSPDRTNYRNGYRDRVWETRAGTVELKIPKVESGAGAVTVGYGGCSVAFAPGLSPSPLVPFPDPRSSVGSGTGAPIFRVRWLFHCFRSGPQSGSHDHVSSSRLVKRSMRFSRTALSYCLPPTVYVAY